MDEEKPLMFTLTKETCRMPPGIFPLRNIIIELLLRCNLKCSFCYASATSTAKRSYELRTDEIFNIISQAKNMGVEDIDLTGGEPLLHPDILKIVKEIHNQGLLLTIQTNATLIEENLDLVDYLKSIKDDVRVFVSINGGTAKTHDELYGVKGAFDKTVEGTRILTSNGIKTCIATTYQKKNFDEIPDIIKLAKSFNADWSGGPVINSGRGSTNQFDPLVLDFMETHKDKHMEAYSTPRYKNRKWQLRYLGCNAGLTGCIVLSNGNVIPCFMDREHVAGNIRKQPLKEIWTKGIFLPRNLDIAKTACSSCKYMIYCAGGCTYFRKVSTGSFNEQAPSICAWVSTIVQMTKDKMYEKVDKKEYTNIRVPNTSKTFKDLK